MSSNPVAIVTGASRGIGRACALYFAQLGYDVALIARTESDLVAVQHEIKALTDGRVESGVFPLDVSDTQGVKDVVERIIKAHGRIDILFNNAGILVPGTSDVDMEQMHKMLHVNLLGAYNLIHAVTPIMKQQKNGTILNLASMAGKRGMAQYGAYCMTKFGLVGLSESLYYELLPYNIRVCAICPSVIDTDMTKDFGIDNKDKIQTDDIVTTIDYILNLSPNAVVHEVIVNCAYTEINGF